MLTITYQAAHWKVKIDSLRSDSDFLAKKVDQENYLFAGGFVSSLHPLLKTHGHELHQLTARQIQQNLISTSNEPAVCGESESSKPLSDEGYNSPIAKSDELKSSTTVSAPFSNFSPSVFAKNPLWMKNLAFGYPRPPLYSPMQMPNVYNLLPFLSQAAMRPGCYLPTTLSNARQLIEHSNANDERKYTRHAKPPYSYSSIIMLALLTDESKALPLREIVRRFITLPTVWIILNLNHRIAILFPFFRGSYLGWKDSIRHNLSSCRSFVKCATSQTADCVEKNRVGSCWTFIPDGMETERLLRQNTYVARSALDAGVRFVKDLRYRIEFQCGFLTEAATLNLPKVRFH